MARKPIWAALGLVAAGWAGLHPHPRPAALACRSARPHRRAGDPLPPAARRALRGRAPRRRRRPRPRPRGAGGPSTDAVAKPAFLSWQSWDPYDSLTSPVSVEYVLAGELRGHRLPRGADGRHAGQGVRAQAVALLARNYARRLHGRHLGRGAKDFGDAEQREQIDAIGENSLLRAATNEDDWVGRTSRSALCATRTCWPRPSPFAGGQGPAPVADADGDVVLDALRRNQRYTVWSYVPQANPSRPTRRRVPGGGRAPPRGRLRGRSRVECRRPRAADGGVLRAPPGRLEINALESVYQAALGVTSGSCSPYEAAVLLETWFREAGGSRTTSSRRCRRRRAAARRLRQQHEARLLPALRGRHDTHAAARHPRARGSRVRERALRRG